MREHGTNARYRLGPDINNTPGSKGCRCAPCTAAGHAYDQQYKQRTAPTLVGADEARRHIRHLRTQGVGLKTIAKQAGVSHGSISKLIYGDPQRSMAPSKRIRRDTHEKILTVTPSQGADGSQVDAAPVWDTVNQLVARGWTKSAIGRAIGQGGKSLQLGTETVGRRNARAIRALLDQPVPPRTSSRGTTWQPVPDPEPDPEPEVETVGYDEGERFIAAVADILEERIDQAHWRKDAACRGRPVWMWFPGRGDHRTEKAARRICNSCLVKTECLAANLGETDGIFGGLSGNERRRIREQQQREGAA